MIAQETKQDQALVMDLLWTTGQESGETSPPQRGLGKLGCVKAP